MNASETPRGRPRLLGPLTSTGEVEVIHLGLHGLGPPQGRSEPGALQDSRTLHSSLLHGFKNTESRCLATVGEPELVLIFSPDACLRLEAAFQEFFPDFEQHKDLKSVTQGGAPARDRGLEQGGK